MVNPTAIEKSRAGKRRALEAVYHLMVVDEATVTSDTDLANTTGIPKQDIQNLRYDLVGIGTLKTQRVTKGKTPANQWTLVDPIERAREKLNAKWAADDKVTAVRVSNIPHKGSGAKASLNGATPEHPVVTPPLVHSSGPEAPKAMAPIGAARYDEPQALVESARQYAGIHKEVDQRFKELEKLGVHIDREKIAKGMTLPHDSRLAAVADALPYIEHLERQAQRLTDQNNDLKTKLGNLPQQQSDMQRLRNSNERLIAENQGLRQQLEGRKGEAPKGAAPATVG